MSIVMNDVLNWLANASKDELKKVNRACVSEIKSRINSECLAEAAKYKVGQTVSFMDRRGVKVTGTIKSINRKSLTLIRCSDGAPDWRVAYQHIIQ